MLYKEQWCRIKRQIESTVRVLIFSSKNQRKINKIRTAAEDSKSLLKVCVLICTVDGILKQELDSKRLICITIFLHSSVLTLEN